MYDDIKLNQDKYGSGSFRHSVGFAFALVGEYFFQLLNFNCTAKRYVSSNSKGARSYPSTAKFWKFMLVIY